MPRKKRANLHFGENSVRNLSIILPCYNEAPYIERKINELLRECRFLEEFEIIIIDDGSSDRTKEKIEQFSRVHQVRKISLQERKGKPNALNLGVSESVHEIILFTDCRQTINEGSVAILLKSIQNQDIGAVTAKLVNNRANSFTRRVVNYIKKRESSSNSTIGAYGALYAIRKECYQNIPNDTILDDLLIPLLVVRNSKSVLFEEKAIVYDFRMERFYSKQRTLRIVQGLIQLIRKQYKIILSLPLWAILYLFCQKYYKLLLPLIFVLFIVNLSILLHPKLALLIFLAVVVISVLLIGIKEFFLLVRLSLNLIFNSTKLHRTNIKWKKLESNTSTNK